MQSMDSAISRLLSHENPSIRYWALKDLTDGSFKNPEILGVQKSILSSKTVSAILKGQRSDGYWAESEDAYWPKWSATVWPLILLAELGVPGAHPMVRIGCEYFLKTVASQDRSWPPPNYPEGDLTGYRSLWEPCVTGNLARTLAVFGYGNDPRVREMYEWLVKTPITDGGWNCETLSSEGQPVSHSSFMSTIEPLWAFSELDSQKWPKGGKEVVARGAEFLLSHKIYRSDRDNRVIDEEWTKLHFPLFYFYDILHALRVLASLGYGHDERVQDALQLLRSKRLPDGTWPMESTYLNQLRSNLVKDLSTGQWNRVRGQNIAYIPDYYQALGKVGESNPWITLNALRVEKWAGKR